MPALVAHSPVIAARYLARASLLTLMLATLSLIDTALGVAAASPFRDFTITFEPGSEELTGAAKQEIQTAAVAFEAANASETNTKPVEIIYDPTCEAALGNAGQSRRRAQRVGKELLELGTPLASIRLNSRVSAATQGCTTDRGAVLLIRIAPDLGFSNLPPGVHIRFAPNGTELDDANLRRITLVASAYISYAPARVLVTGHDDKCASVQASMQLSKERAQHVARALIAKNVPSGKIRTSWKGQDEPFDPGALGNECADALSRRVTIDFR